MARWLHLIKTVKALFLVLQFKYSCNINVMWENKYHTKIRPHLSCFIWLWYSQWSVDYISASFHRQIIMNFVATVAFTTHAGHFKTEDIMFNIAADVSESIQFVYFSSHFIRHNNYSLSSHCYEYRLSNSSCKEITKVFHGKTKTSKIPSHVVFYFSESGKYLCKI